MKQVELITDKDCPNVQPAREQIEQAFAALGEAPKWQEWDRDDSEAPDYVRNYGSPTVLVEGADVAGKGTESDANCCRVYRTDEGIRGVPSVNAIVAALRSTAHSPH